MILAAVNWGLVWGVWAAVVLVSFGLLEWIGWKKDRVYGTLSYRVWSIIFSDAHRRLVGEHPRKPRGIFYFVVLAPLVWLLIHFAFGGRFG